MARLRLKLRNFGPSSAIVAKIMKLGFQSDYVTYDSCNREFLSNLLCSGLEESCERWRLYLFLDKGIDVDDDLDTKLETIEPIIADAGRVLQVLQDLQEGFGVMADGLCETGQSSVAVGLLLGMLKVGYYPDRFNYVTVVESLCNDGKADEALDFVSKLIRGKGLSICNYLIRDLCDDDHCHLALDCLDVLVAMRIFPDQYAYNILLDDLLKEGDDGLRWHQIQNWP
ncbi:hypothetical protein Tsubulata_016712 [Turnera subulata]|uniref:Uncharacterized protein n=1 Tax=Turnera subulata TaxID=218843 RepID=A0A9Q0GBP2_9ROSI|nr:hypothetical protein Tsubulata_016712 [Turnera subulata]